MQLLFYMLENVQKAEVNITSYADREKKNTEKEFVNAPEKGTYVIVRGNYKGRQGGDGSDGSNPEEEVQGAVAYTIHLGDFSTTGSVDNFTVRRNTKYKYNITVNGVNSIIVEAKTGNEKQPGAEGDIMKTTNNVYYLDAHFETVMLKLDKNKFETYSF